MTQNSARSRSDVVSQRDVIHIRRINSPDQTFLSAPGIRRSEQHLTHVHVVLWFLVDVVCLDSMDHLSLRVWTHKPANVGIMPLG
jgi:hypothetical protein